MYRWIARRALRGFRRAYDYDTTYLEEMLDRAPDLFRRFESFSRAARYRRWTPPDAWFAAKLVGVLAEDCGPCTQLVTDMALRAGVPPALVRAVLEGDRSSMNEAVAAAWTFARAACGQSPELDESRERVRELWGEGAVIELSMAVALARVYPVTKRGMGYARACMKVEVGDSSVAVSGVAA